MLRVLQDPSSLVATPEQFEGRSMVYAGAGRTLYEARAPSYIDLAGGRVAIVAAGSSNARLVVAADPSVGDAGQPNIAPIRVNKTHYIQEEHFRQLRAIIADSSVDVASSGATAPGVQFAYPDRRVYDGPPSGGLAVEGVSFAPTSRGRVQTDALDRNSRHLPRLSLRRRARQTLWPSRFIATRQSTGGGIEEPAEFIQPLAQRMVNAGARAVIGHGPHMLGGFEVYRCALSAIRWDSLGNFIFSIEAMSSFVIALFEHQGCHRSPELSICTTVSPDAATSHGSGSRSFRASHLRKRAHLRRDASDYARPTPTRVDGRAAP